MAADQAWRRDYGYCFALGFWDIKWDTNGKYPCAKLVGREAALLTWTSRCGGGGSSRLTDGDVQFNGVSQNTEYY